MIKKRKLDQVFLSTAVFRMKDFSQSVTKAIVRGAVELSLEPTIESPRL